MTDMCLHSDKVRTLNGCHAYQWTQFELCFIRAHWGKMQNKQIATLLGHRLTLVRTKCYEMGMKHMELQYWTDEQIAYLLANYKTHGDTELAEIFASKWPKAKGWSKKHIEKKRCYLVLKRTDEEKAAIKENQRLAGVFAEGQKKTWQIRGMYEIGTIRKWYVSGRDVLFIKLETGYVHYGRWLWESVHGPVPEGMAVCFKDGNNLNAVIENLVLLTKAEVPKLQGELLTDRYIAGKIAWGDQELRDELLKRPEILEIKRLQLQLSRTIKKVTNESN